jgi:Arc/MetJ-type ribon-helix-helix transcriptional regulator
MTIEEVVGKVLLDEHADVIREAVRAVAAELMNAHRRDAQRRSATPGFGGEHHRAEACVPCGQTRRPADTSRHVSGPTSTSPR